MDFTINTPVATIGVRGTEFDVLTKPTETEIAVHEGTIEVTSAAGTERVSRGQVYSVNIQGIGGIKAEPSPEMKKSTALMLTLVADQGSQEAANQSRQQTQPESQSQATALPPSASLAFQKAVAGKNKENLLYMDLAGGRLVIELRPDLAPRHVSRIKELARQGFYDGLSFHFVRRGYVAETGDPTGTGTGGPGYMFDNELSPLRRHDGPGLLSMANSGIRDGRGTNGSQFFITSSPQPQLDARHTVFGKVIAGMEVVDQLQRGDVIRLVRVWDGTTPPS